MQGSELAGRTTHEERGRVRPGESRDDQVGKDSAQFRGATSRWQGNK